MPEQLRIRDKSLQGWRLSAYIEYMYTYGVPGSGNGSFENRGT
jgi:hypothetical protein